MKQSEYLILLSAIWLAPVASMHVGLLNSVISFVLGVCTLASLYMERK